MGQNCTRTATGRADGCEQGFADRGWKKRSGQFVQLVKLPSSYVCYIVYIYGVCRIGRPNGGMLRTFFYSYSLKAEVRFDRMKEKSTTKTFEKKFPDQTPKLNPKDSNRIKYLPLKNTGSLLPLRVVRITIEL